MSIEEIIPPWALQEAGKVADLASSGGGLRNWIAYSLLMTQRRTAEECVRIADADQTLGDQIRARFLGDEIN